MKLYQGHRNSRCDCEVLAGTNTAVVTCFAKRHRESECEVLAM